MENTTPKKRGRPFKNKISEEAKNFNIANGFREDSKFGEKHLEKYPETKKEYFAKMNGFSISDPILGFFNEEKGDLDISKEKQIELAKGLYKHPIFFIFTMNGQVTKVTTDNVLTSLKELSKSIIPTSIKTASIFHYELNGKVYHRILRVGPMRMLLGNDQRKLMMAKIINSTLGLFGEDLYK